MRLVLLLGLAIAAAAVTIALLQQATPSPPPPAPLPEAEQHDDFPPPSTGVQDEAWTWRTVVAGRTIERRPWQPDRPFAEEISELRRPVILENTMVTKWPALRKWSDPDYLASSDCLQQLDEVEVGPHHTFAFLDRRAGLARAHSERHRLPRLNMSLGYDRVPMSGRELMDRTFGDRQGENGSVVYWYGKVRADLLDDVRPDDWLWRSASDRATHGMYMWVGGENARPAVHFDSDHNFFVHCAGDKRFVLFPPTESDKLYPFPRSHPRWHKAQVQFAAPDLDRFPRFAEAKAWEAHLGPGDVLYVPPMWWHHVQAIAPSVSLADWSQGTVHGTMKRVYERKYTYDAWADDDKDTVVKTHAAIKQHVVMLLERVVRQEHARSHGLDTSTLDVSSSDGAVGADDEAQGVADVMAKLDLDAAIAGFVRKRMFEPRWAPLRHVFADEPRNSALCSVEPVFREAFRQMSGPDVDFVWNQFELHLNPGYDYDERPDIRAIRDSELFDYIETIGEQAIGGAEHLYDWIERCFAEPVLRHERSAWTDIREEKRQAKKDAKLASKRARKRSGKK